MSSRDTFIALAVVFLMSVNLILQKIAVGYLSVVLIGFLRASLVLPFLLFYPKPPKNLWKHAVCGFFLVAFYLILFGYGLQTNIGTNLSAFVLQFQVFFVILCCFLFLGEKPLWHQNLGILVACLGVYYLHLHSSSEDLPTLGVILLIASCLSHGIGVALAKKFGLGKSIKDIAWLSALAAPPLLIACLSFDGPTQTIDSILDISAVALGCIVFATFAVTLWGAYLWLNLIQRISAATVVPFMLLIPIFSGILSYFAFGETLSTHQMLSGFIIILGVMVAQGFHKQAFQLAFWLKEKSRL